MPRARDEFDDDDFDGYLRPQSQGSGNGRFIATVVGAVVVVAMVAGVLVLFVSRGRRAEVAVEHARAEAMRVDEARGATRVRPSPTAWSRMIGTWSRTPAEKEVGGFPYHMEFRADATATIIHLGSENKPVQQDVTVEVISDDNDVARARLHVLKGLYDYTFFANRDGTLSLDDGKGGLNFTRAK